MGGSWHSFGLGLIYENPDRFLPSNVKDHFSPSIYFPQNLIINFDVVYKHSLRLHRQRYHAPVNAMKYSFFVRSENHNKRCNNVLTQSIKFECQACPNPLCARCISDLCRMCSKCNMPLFTIVREFLLFYQIFRIVNVNSLYQY